MAGALATLNHIAHDEVGLEIMGRQQIADKAGLVAHLRQVMLMEPNQWGASVSPVRRSHRPQPLVCHVAAPPEVERR